MKPTRIGVLTNGVVGAADAELLALLPECFPDLVLPVVDDPVPLVEMVLPPEVVDKVDVPDPSADDGWPEPATEPDGTDPDPVVLPELAVVGTLSD
jgi:hypothetical protein